jgi:hypothetical protein
MVYSRYKTGHFLTSFLLHQFLQNFKFFFISAGISEKGSGRLYFVQRTMKQDQYITLLENRLIPLAKEWFVMMKI